MLPGIVEKGFGNSGTPSSASRGRSRNMGNKIVSYCYYGRFSITPAVIRCYFRRQNLKLTIKSTCCPAGGVNFPVLTANAARTSPRPSTPIRSSIRAQVDWNTSAVLHSTFCGSTVCFAQASLRSLFPLHPSPFTLHSSLLTLHGSRITDRASFPISGI